MSFSYTAWMPWLRPLPCTTSGRPRLRDEEVELRMLDKVEMMDENDQQIHENGVLIITNQRIIFITGCDEVSSGVIPNFYIDLRCTTDVWADSPWFRWPRIIVRPAPINAAILHPSRLSSSDTDIHLPDAQQEDEQPFSVSKAKSSLPQGVYLSAAGDYLPPQHKNPYSPASPLDVSTWGRVVFAMSKANDRDQILNYASRAVASNTRLCKIGSAFEPYGGSTCPQARQKLSKKFISNTEGKASIGAVFSKETMGSSLVNSKKEDTSMASHGFGIAGILRRRELEQKRMDAELKEAFGDLTTLMDHAKNVVKLAERVAQQKQAATGGTSTSSQTEAGGSGNTLSSASGSFHTSNELDEDKFRELLSSMGITSPVTKASAGGLFHEQIAMQLIDFLEKPVALFGGVMTLTDVYSLYCRARGTALISPEDLLFAARRWEKIEECPLRLQKFSGTNTLVVCSKDFDEENLRRRTLNALRGRQSTIGRGTTGGATSYDLSKELHISAYVMNEVITYLENVHKSICRDVAPDGVYYYLNFFLES